MLFNSIQFLFFFPVVYLLYLVLSHRWQNYFLILASCLFYAAWNWKFLGVMFVSITVDYFCAKAIDAGQKEGSRKLFLGLSIAVNLLILGFFKYANFFLDGLEALLATLHISFACLPLKIILPLGISFYTFEAISYVVDVYRRQVKPAARYSDYLLFVIYFPHLIAGPIMRAKQFMPQIAQPRKVSLALFYEGSFLFFWGLFEKMFVADNMGRIANGVFMQGPYEGTSVLLALYAFAFQIFCDFDGYSNMARGLGKCMGFEITINFRLPYFAVNPREFWQRWHISLSTWLRDYLYIPLGGNRHGAFRMYLALLLTMLLGGLWHGASWTFVLWGAYHGIILMIHRLFEGRINWKVPRLIQTIFFFQLVVLGWLLFRAQSLTQIAQMLQALFFHFDISQAQGWLWLKWAGLVCPLLFIQVWQERSKDLMIVYKQAWFIRMMIYALLTYLLMGWGVMRSQEFIYFQF